jgi:phenylacetate-CoA ligase
MDLSIWVRGHKPVPTSDFFREGEESRVEDMCYTSDGRQMLRFDTVFKGVRAIREAQIMQEHIDSFVVHVVPAQGFGSDDVEKVTGNVRAHVGEARVRVVPVPAIPRSASGKFRAVVCSVPREERERLAVALGRS